MDGKEELKNFLLHIYSDNMPVNRIEILADNLQQIIIDNNCKLNHIVFLLDEFEGGVADIFNFTRIFAHIIKSLPVQKENAERLFDFLQYCKNSDFYFALLGDYWQFLNDEQRTIIDGYKDEFPVSCPFLYGRR